MPKYFDFVSPEIRLNEIDQSFVPREARDDGLLIIGTAQAGPALQPMRFRSIEAMNKVLGVPQNGIAANSDTWRDGNTTYANYGLYSAQQWMNNASSPVTFIRLLGEDSPNTTTGYASAGWNLGGPSLKSSLSDIRANCAAYGLFLIPSASSAATNNTGSLAAIFYASGSALTLSGTIAQGHLGTTAGKLGEAGPASTTTSSACTLIESIGADGAFEIEIFEGTGVVRDSNGKTSRGGGIKFNMMPDSSFFIRKRVETNPQKMKSGQFATPTASVFLGESFETGYNKIAPGSNGAGKTYGILLPLVSGSTNFASNLGEALAAKTGWFINRNADPQNDYTDWTPHKAEKLFRLVSLHEGEWFQKNYAVAIEDLQLAAGDQVDSTFSVSIYRRGGGSEPIEKYTNCNLNRQSSNFVGRKIGTRRQSWDANNKVFNVIGEFLNRSDLIRVEMSDEWNSGLTDKSALPFGFYGPSRPKSFTMLHSSKGVHALGDTTNSGTKAKITFEVTGQGNPTGDNWTLTARDHNGNMENFKITLNTGATADTDWTDNGAGVDPRYTATLKGLEGNPLGFANTITTLFQSSKLASYNETNDGTATPVLTLEADVAGPQFALGWTETLDSNSAIGTHTIVTGVDTDDSIHAWVQGNLSCIYSGGETNVFAKLPVDFTGSFEWPKLGLTEQSTDGGGSYLATDLHGVRNCFKDKSEAADIQIFGGPIFGRDYSDLVLNLPGGLDIHGTSNMLETSFIFTLDDMVNSGNDWYYQSGSLKSGASYTQDQGTAKLINDKQVKQFISPFFGGRDGLNILEANPFSNNNVLSGKSETTSYAYYSICKAIDMIEDSEFVQYDVVAMPEINNSALVSKLLKAVKKRRDSLAIVDIDDGYKEKYENSGVFDSSGGAVSTIVDNANSVRHNTSYGATYHPRLFFVDPNGSGVQLVVPASMAGVGVIAQAETLAQAPWFAPAGFNRGGLTNLGYVTPLKKLTKANRDRLYQVNINPIALFPAMGEMVAFGQKTLQLKASALDRINVRRLMIYMKKRIGNIAKTLLFEQNVRSTWIRFKTRASNVLDDIQARFGITEYKLVLDETTTTADLVDRNIMYAKVFVKPARAIEFIAIDFIVTRTGVEF